MNLTDDATETLDVRVYSELDPERFSDDPRDRGHRPTGYSLPPIALSSTEPTGGLQALYAPEGTFIYVEYVDALGTPMRTRTSMWLEAPEVGRKPSTNQPQVDLTLSASSASIRVVSDEPVQVSIFWGLTCANLANTEVSNAFSDDQEIEIAGLEDTQTYACRLLLTRRGGQQPRLR